MGQYLAGLWRETLVTGLSWPAIDPINSLRPKEWRASTWSWASVTVRLEPGFYDRVVSRAVPCIKVIEAITTPKGTDPTGELSPGELVIRGRGVKLQVDHGSWSSQTGLVDSSCKRSSLCFLKGDEQKKVLEDRHNIFDSRWDYAIAAPGPDHVPDGSEVMIVKLSKNFSSLDPVTPFQSSWLILQSSKHHPEAFEHIGIIFLQSYESSDLHLQVEKAYRDSPEVEMKII